MKKMYLYLAVLFVLSGTLTAFQFVNDQPLEGKQSNGNMDIRENAPSGEFIFESVNTTEIFVDSLNSNNSIAGLESRGYKTYFRGTGPPGTQPIWFQGDPATFGNPAFNGPANGFVQSSFQTVSGTNNIDNWLVSPKVNMLAGDSLSFYTLAFNSLAFPDSIRVMYSAAGDSIPEASWTELGRFFIPSFTGQNANWTRFAFAIPSDGANGRFAIRYSVVNGGPSGANSSTIGIDYIRVTRSLPSLAPFSLLFPPSGITFITEPGNNTLVDINWRSSAPGATYKWKFGAPTIGSVILDIPSNNSGNDTVLTVTPAAVDGILAGLGVQPGDSVVGEWGVWAFSGSDSLKSIETFAITFRRAPAVALNPFNLLFPPDGLTLVTSPSDNTQIDINWSSSASAGVTYKWKFGAPTISSVILDIPSNNSGNDTVLTVTPAAVDGILAGLGVLPGDSVVGQWAVWAFNGVDSLKSVQTFNITFKRSALSTFNLLFPPTGITFVSNPSDNTPIDINWTKSGPGVTYRWKFGAPNIGNVILNLASNNSGADTVLTVTPAAVDGILAGLGVQPGDSVVGEWAVWGFLGSDSLKSAETFAITFRRDKESSISQQGTEIPFEFAISQNFPNPFNPSTVIKFAIPQQSFVSLKVFDLSGREVSDLVNQTLTPGNYEAVFDASALSSGVYFYRIEAGSFIQTKRMLLVK